MAYERHVHDLLVFIVSTVFGLSHICVMIQDKHAEVIETGNGLVCAD